MKMFGFRVMIVLVTCLSWSHCKIDDYCSICHDHTMCKFHGIGQQCKNPGGSGVTEEEKNEILDVHNWLRRIVASGYETRGAGSSQPKAANLRKLTWDGELAKVAQRWADQCRFEHDTCRNDPRWNVGQNIYWKWRYPTHHTNWTEAIISWYDEVSSYDPKEVENYRFEAATGHYTQMLWHDTFAIGCGRRDYGQNKLYVCNYGPAGNWLGEPMYAIGEPCSKCPQGTVCDEYLCASRKSETSTIKLGDGIPVLRKTEDAGKDNSDSVKNQDKPKLNAQNGSQSGNTKPSKSADDDEKKSQLNDVLLDVENEHKLRSLPADENDIDIDADTRKRIEEIDRRIKELVKDVVKKYKTQNHVSNDSQSKQ